MKRCSLILPMLMMTETPLVRVRVRVRVRVGVPTHAVAIARQPSRRALHLLQQRPPRLAHLLSAALHTRFDFMRLAPPRATASGGVADSSLSNRTCWFQKKKEFPPSPPSSPFSLRRGVSTLQGGLPPPVSSNAARSAVLALDRWQSSGQRTQR